MAQHRSVGDDRDSRFDPHFDDDRDEARRGREGAWRGEGRDRAWRHDENQSWRAETRGRHDGWGGLMFDGEERDRSRYGDDAVRSERPRAGRDDDDRSVLSRVGEQARSGFSDEDHDRSGHGRRRPVGSDADEWFGGRSRAARAQPMSHYGAEHGQGGFQGDYSGRGQPGGFGGAGDWHGGRQRMSSHPDDHYLSWRDQQLEALDRDYQEYCREREQQFHQDFSTWREKRRETRSARDEAASGPVSGEESGELLLDQHSADMETEAKQPSTDR